LLEDLLRTLGPDIGIPAFRALLPWAPRGAMERFLRAYRLAHRRRRRARLYSLRWTRPGTVWAADLTQPPKPVDGIYRFVLSVRDLASGFSLAWSPLPRGSAADVAEALSHLFTVNEPPIVLKTDNGSCFLAQEVQALLRQARIVHLRSPRAWPRFNGSCEAGIGVLRTLTEVSACGQGLQGSWSVQDLEQARIWANELTRQHRGHLQQARATWDARSGFAEDERTRFHKLLTRILRRNRASSPSSLLKQARTMRRAIKSTLMKLGLLEISSSWVRMRSTGRGVGPSYR
jgi:transposase InsO family protein